LHRNARIIIHCHLIQASILTILDNSSSSKHCCQITMNNFTRKKICSEAAVAVPFSPIEISQETASDACAASIVHWYALRSRETLNVQRSSVKTYHIPVYGWPQSRSVPVPYISIGKRNLMQLRLVFKHVGRCAQAAHTLFKT
jgi:hypothetical protein